ncbi:hypothetical protein M422DRAFT_54118 [Sphaerobolus stellatus SS14]|uniref:Ubiquitin-like protease family profile domain-containing protein n=1 Tax=Sphaerobolus stellatus (strain SS14) TaxID=990650 RepID=A0A0C9TIY3_SPHS4|nr:hypothetical protein M422DRAFT_54118 [Sphaerobolus stellatus SS14]
MAPINPADICVISDDSGTEMMDTLPPESVQPSSNLFLYHLHLYDSHVSSIRYESFFPAKNGECPQRARIDGPKLARLQIGRWSNDDLVQFGVLLWYERFLTSKHGKLKALLFSSFCYNQCVIHGRSYLGRNNDLRNIDLLVIPMHDVNHWFSIVVLFPGQCLVFEVKLNVVRHGIGWRINFDPPPPRAGQNLRSTIFRFPFSLMRVIAGRTLFTILIIWFDIMMS